MKNKRYNKFIWPIIAIAIIGGGVLVFNSEKADPLEQEEKQSIDMAEEVEISDISQNSEIITKITKIEELKRISEISQDPEIIAEAERILEIVDSFKRLSAINGEIRQAPPGSVTVLDSTSDSSPWVQYISDKRAAELGISRHQVTEFQKIFNYYRQRLGQHITDNSTIEVLGERHHRIKVPIMETNSEIRNAVSQELRLLFGREKYDEFTKLNDGNLDNFFYDYWENPRTVEIQVPGEIDRFGGEIIKYIETTHFKNGVTQRSGGKLHSRQYEGYQAYIDLIASYNR